MNDTVKNEVATKGDLLKWIEGWDDDQELWCMIHPFKEIINNEHFCVDVDKMALGQIFGIYKVDRKVLYDSKIDSNDKDRKEES